ncbi:glycosyltransferase family 4 protein [Gemmata sp. JC673]|uniref:Glycosyltransferase family 4 protein n=1 Tax=Gemmata algarum TaxID=2975278 RepID=A0ABU5ESK0_9BACT|nr:glycosyltransferase family 4 protein [Gemmata algarum]MDY3558321.1 glycosyltransferase family 4 protein [Gemmata algarum]
MIATVFAARAGAGGLGLQAATAAVGLSLAGREVVALGPGRAAGWPLTLAAPSLRWEDTPARAPSWFARQIVRRLRPGRLIWAHDRYIGAWAGARVADLRPNLVYAFTQVGLESLEWAKRHGVPTVLDNPNGHIRGFAEVYRAEWAKWVGGAYRGHPTEGMVRRVEREYELADRIRVSSDWAKRSMVARGVPADKVFVCPQPIDTDRFRPPAARPAPAGALRVVYVGSLDVRKGFAYLLRAVRQVGPGRVQMELVGGTGDRGSRRLLDRERSGLNVTLRPGDPVPAYHRAELFVLPSLEDGFGFVAAEALACGLPVVVTDQCGAAEWVRPGETGWVTPAGSTDALATALNEALARRDRLAEMGREARRAIDARDPMAAFRQLAEKVSSAPCGS